MSLKAIKKSVDISVTVEKVWEVLVTTKYYQAWASAFSAGANVETDWKEGSEVIFTDDSAQGIVGIVERAIVAEFLSIKYKAVIKDGIEDTESALAKSIIGARESYALSEQEGGSHLKIESEIGEQYFDIMNEAWDIALVKIKELAEAN